MTAIRQKVREGLKRLTHRLFLLGDRIGVHAMPPHYYSPISSRRLLRRNEARWRHPSGLPGIEWNLDAQAAWVAEMADCVPEISLSEVYERSATVGGFRYGPIEAQLLYCFVRHHAPRRVVEIGSGSTTLLMVEAARRNVAEGRGGTQITAIDPYAYHGLSDLAEVDVLETDALDLSTSELRLEANDLLFIDSTHTVRTGSEVPHLYLELVPELPSDVWIHVHDIYLPFLYSSQIYDGFFDWQETTLVAALLTNNDAIGVMACMSALHHARPHVLHSVFPEYRPKPMSEGIATSKEGHFPSSLWLRTADGPDARPRDQTPSR